MPSFCLILEPIPLVAKDLATTARENLGCRPLLAASEAEALRLIEDLGPGARLSLAFVHDTAAAFAGSPLRLQLEKRGTEIILLGPDPGSAWPKGDWPALDWPFSTGQVLELVMKIDRMRPRPGAA